MTKASKANQKAQAERARKEHVERMERRNRAYILARARELDHKARDFLVTSCEKGFLSVTQEALDKELETIWEKNKHHCHEDCRSYFMEYGSFTYSNLREEGTRCIICALPLLCGGKKRKHEYKSISQEECYKRNIYHGGRCYHVSECIHCGDISAVDSSD